MTKQEKIQEAYDTSWDLCKDYIDENGYCVVFKDLDSEFKGVAGNQTHFKEHEIEGGQMTHSIHGKGISFRPKQLYGIEHNNGWNKIEDGLPERNICCQVFTDTGDYYSSACLTDDGVWTQNKYSRCGRVSIVTHWKPIVVIAVPLPIF